MGAAAVRGRATFDQLSSLQQDYDRKRYHDRSNWTQCGDTKLFPVMQATGVLLNDAYLYFLQSIGAEVSNVSLHTRFTADNCFRRRAGHVRSPARCGQG